MLAWQGEQFCFSSTSMHTVKRTKIWSKLTVDYTVGRGSHITPSMVSLVGDIRGLDVFKHVSFPVLKEAAAPPRVTRHMLQSCAIFHIEGVLAPDEVKDVVGALPVVHDEIADPQYRDASRLLTMDSGRQFTHALATRLFAAVDVPPEQPFGFFSRDVDNWLPTPTLNNCFRVSTYAPGSVGFQWHRDAPFTSLTAPDDDDGSADAPRPGLSRVEGSTHSVVVCLQNTCAGDDGETVFSVQRDQEFRRVPEAASGLSVAEELADWPGMDTVHVKLQAGDALLFDQRLVHCATPVRDGTKVVTRTDVVRTSAHQHDFSAASTFSCDPALVLARRLFRCAELAEVVLRCEPTRGLVDVGALKDVVRECYERSLHLRLNAALVPCETANAALDRARSLLRDVTQSIMLGVPVPVDMSADVSSSEAALLGLTFVEQDGVSCTFKLHTPSDEEPSNQALASALHAAALFAVIASTKVLAACTDIDVAAVVDEVRKVLSCTSGVYETAPEPLIAPDMKRPHAKSVAKVLETCGGTLRKGSASAVRLVTSAEVSSVPSWKHLCYPCRRTDDASTATSARRILQESILQHLCVSSPYTCRVVFGSWERFWCMGEVTFEGPTTSFNHAGCHCGSYNFTTDAVNKGAPPAEGPTQSCFGFIVDFQRHFDEIVVTPRLTTLM